MSTLRKIAVENIRKLAISSQGLDDRGDDSGRNKHAGRDELLKTFESIGCVQIDPIRAVERTQLLVLWSRLGQFDLKALDHLMWEERALFEYWAHAASIVMTKDFPIYWRRMRDWAAGDRGWSAKGRQWVEDNKELGNFILAELEEKGPLPPTAFHDKPGSKWHSSGWYNGQSSRLMLEYLWEQGHILVDHRQGLTKLWNLRDRCLPDWTPRENLSWPDTVYRAAQKSLFALGAGLPVHINKHFTRGGYPDLKSILEKLVGEGLIEEIQVVDGSELLPGPWYIHRDRLSLLNDIEKGDWYPRTVLLSPFDNLICHRDRTEMLFDFHYRIEIYVPKAKRKYGYYVLPILHGDKLIGRIDPKLDRKTNILTINNIYAEDHAPRTRSVGREIARNIRDLAQFIGAKDIIIANKPPYGWQSSIKF